MKLYLSRHDKLADKVETALRSIQRDRPKLWDLISPELLAWEARTSVTHGSRRSGSVLSDEPEDGFGHTPSTLDRDEWGPDDWDNYERWVGHQDWWGTDEWVDNPSPTGGRPSSNPGSPWKSKKALVPLNKRDQLKQLLTSCGKKMGVDNLDFKMLCELLDESFSETLLPDQLMGWIVLQKAGLTAQERSTLLGVSRGHEHLSLSSISQALRNQWEDTELREHDKKSFKEAHVVDEEVEPPEAEAEDAHWAEDEHEHEDWDELPEKKVYAVDGEDPESEDLEAYEAEILDLSDPDEQEAWQEAYENFREQRK